MTTPENGTGVHDPRPADFTTELRSTQKSTRAIISLIDHDVVRDLAGGDDVVRALEEFADAKIPTARALARAALVGAIETEQIYVLWHSARKAFLAASPAVIDMFLQKMEEGHDCKYSERLLVESMKGMGLLTPGEPVSGEGREAMITDDDLRNMSDEEIRQALLDQGRGDTEE